MISYSIEMMRTHTKKIYEGIYYWWDDQSLHDIKFQHKHDDEVIAKNFAEIIFSITSALTGQ